jgi:colanic acid/amylovoran biosynthesis protein
MKIYLTGQNNFGNRGCEALVRSTVAVVRAKLPGCEFLVPSLDIARDQAQWQGSASQGVHFVPLAPIPGRFVQWSRVCSRLPFLASLPWPALHREHEIPKGMEQCDAVLSIGGDNYSLDYDLASLAYFVAVAELGLKRGLPVMLWGASVGPFSAMPVVERHVAAHLCRLSHVTVRESNSLTYLHKIGVSANVTQVADSAFALLPEAFDTTAFWPGPSLNGVVGINVSPLIEGVRRRAGNHTPLPSEVCGFIRAIVTEGFSVVLVPHVAPLDGRPSNSDDHLLAAIAAQLTDLGARVTLAPPGLNAVQLKHLISRCRYFIGARTHATVAALSMGVPTVSIAYSVKAVGINRDLFGHERYVLDTRTLDMAALHQAFSMLVQEEAAIRDVLAQKQPSWRTNAGAGAPILAALLAPTLVAN